MNSYSYSKIKAWTECPLSYKLTYLDKVGKDESDPMTLGAAAHEFFQAWVEDGIKGNLPGVADDLLDHLSMVALNCWAKEPKDQSLYDEYLSICDAFIQNLDWSDLKGWQTSCELKLGLMADGLPCDFLAENVWMRGIIDRLDIRGTTARITDYKTGFHGKSDTFQVQLYAYLISKYYPDITNFEVVIHYVRSNWKEKWQFPKEKLSGIEFQIKAITETMKEDQRFKAKPGSRCSSCMVAFACTKKASSIKEIGNKRSAQKVAEDILAIESQLESKKEILKGWIQDNGEIKVNGETFSFFPYETWKGDTKELVSVLTNNNIEPWNYLKCDTKEIKKLCKTDDNLANNLAQALTISSTLRFTHKKDE